MAKSPDKTLMATGECSATVALRYRIESDGGRSAQEAAKLSSWRRSGLADTMLQGHIAARGGAAQFGNDRECVLNLEPKSLPMKLQERVGDGTEVKVLGAA